MERAARVRERENVSYDQTAATNTTTANINATSYATAATTKPTTATEQPNDDDAAATRTFKGYDGLIRKNNQ